MPSNIKINILKESHLLQKCQREKRQLSVPRFGLAVTSLLITLGSLPYKVQLVGEHAHWILQIMLSYLNLVISYPSKALR
jgi:hypothetical protein